MQIEATTAMHFTTQQVMDALEEVVKGKEMYVDPRSKTPALACRYLVNGEPSCIVGQVLSFLGVPIGVLHTMDCSTDPQIGSGGMLVLRQAGVTLDRVAAAILIQAQSTQDGGDTWGRALTDARLVYENAASID